MLKPAMAAVLAALMIAPNVSFAAENAAALPPGKAAGVHKAAMEAPLWVWIVGIGLVGVGIGLAASSGGGNSNGSTTGTQL
jgi:hypothetical protein